MQQNLLLPKLSLLENNGLRLADVEEAMAAIMSRHLDYADTYFEHSLLESWTLEDGIVKGGSYATSKGIGVRAVSGEKTGFAYADEISADALKKAGALARGITRSGREGKYRLALKPTQGVKEYYPMINPLGSLTEAEKLSLLEQADRVARATDPRVKQVIASLSGSMESVLVLASDGTLAEDVRPLVRFNVSVIVEQGGRREQASSGGGGRFNYQELLNADLATESAKEAVRQALVNLDAVEAPAGTMEVVLGPGWPGVLLHEAIGHGLEGDFNRKGTSAFTGMIGEKIASADCTIVDDGTLPKRRGSLNVDDEGTVSQNTVLIENGILKGYMQDKTNARLTGTEPTGNGRRESYAHLPLPRMTNTYMLAGQKDPGEIIESVSKGLYAVGFSGGQVDITSGKFVFSASEAYLIENGKVGHAVKGATLIGNGADALKRISMVGNDLKLDKGIGVCGKDGQSVPVGVGQPTLRLDGITVGGTSQS